MLPSPVALSVYSVVIPWALLVYHYAADAFDSRGALEAGLGVRWTKWPLEQEVFSVGTDGKIALLPETYPLGGSSWSCFLIN